MARKIRKAPKYIKPSMGLKGWQDAIRAGIATPEQAGIAYSGAPMFRRQAQRMARRAPTGAPSISYEGGGITRTPKGFQYAPRDITITPAEGTKTPSATDLSMGFWGATPTPTQRAQDEQAIAEAERDTAGARAETAQAPAMAGLRRRGIEQPLNIQQQQAEQEAAMGAPTLESANIANQLALQQLEERKLRAPIERKLSEEGAPLSQEAAFAGLPEQLRIAPAMERLGMEGGGAPEADFQRQEALGYAGNIMAMTGLDQMIGLVDPEQNIMADIAADSLQPNESTPKKMQTLVSAVKEALSQASPEEAMFVISQIRANPYYAELLKWTKGRLGGYLKGRWSLMSNRKYMEMNRLAKELQSMVE